jgi:hypothetical protein
MHRKVDQMTIIPRMQNVVLTNIQHIDQPNMKPDVIGAQNEMFGNEVHANQKKEMAKKGAATIAISKRTSGGTGFGAYLTTARS